MPARIIQISDCHLFQHANVLNKELNPYLQLKVVLDWVFTQHEDLTCLVFTGDLAQDEQAQTYQLFNQLLANYCWQIPLIILAGNHDNLDFMQQYLIGATIQVCATEPINPVTLNANWSLLPINSHQENANGAGFIAQTYLDRIATIFKQRNKHLLLALHHHIQSFGSFIDNYPLINSAELLSEIFAKDARSDLSKVVIHGHVHTARQGRIDSLAWFSAPSTFAQFNHDNDSFELIKQFGVNDYILDDDGQVTVKTHFWKPNE